MSENNTKRDKIFKIRKEQKLQASRRERILSKRLKREARKSGTLQG